MQSVHGVLQFNTGIIDNIKVIYKIVENVYYFNLINIIE